VAEHWNGTDWHAAALPAGLQGWLAAASAVSPTDIWAVSVYNGYALHWDGSRWSVAKRWKETANPAALTGVTAVSRDDVWVFGGNIPGVTPPVGLGTWHFNGKAWTRVGGQGRNIAEASALSASDIWGIGGYHDAYPQVDHYDGTAWRPVPLPAALGTPHYILAVSPHEVWLATENNITYPAHPMLIRWNGSAWHRVAIPAPVASMLGTISTDGHGGIWVEAQSTDRTQAWLLHRSASGTWTKNTLRPASLAEALAPLPGTTSMWAVGAYFSAGHGTAAIWARGPVG
jgi:hypothetical protein